MALRPLIWTLAQQRDLTRRQRCDLGGGQAGYFRRREPDHLGAGQGRDLIGRQGPLIWAPPTTPRSAPASRPPGWDADKALRSAPAKKTADADGREERRDLAGGERRDLRGAQTRQRRGGETARLGRCQGADLVDGQTGGLCAGEDAELRYRQCADLVHGQRRDLRGGQALDLGRP